MKAYLFEVLKDNTVQCGLCNHRCMIKDGQRGICQVRENRNGELTTLVYGKLIAQHIDPIEKKPLFHFMPGTSSYSIATVGCNFQCHFCQNADISQLPKEHDGRIMGNPSTPEAVVSAAKKGNCSTIAYTYTEPTVFFEFAYETAKLAHAAGIKNIFVTNGYMTAETLKMIHPCLDAANVDLKSFNEDFYRTYCGARLAPVKETLIAMKAFNIFVEVTTLLIPGLNDDPDELKKLARFLFDNLGPETPWHISRFHPTYRLMDRPSTPVASLVQARQIGLAEGLRYVFTGNIPGDEGENTFCYKCGQMVIERYGYHIRKTHMTNGRCDHCDTKIDGVGM